MRIVAAIAVWILFVGSVGLFTAYRNKAALTAAPLQVTTAAAEGRYALEITTTFALAPDPFAVQSSEGEPPPALLVRLGELDILRQTDPVAAGAPLKVSPVEGMVAGENEIYLEASPPLDQDFQSQAVRVRILRGGLPLAEKTLWAGPGEKVAGTFKFTLAQDQPKDHDHGHP